MVARVLTLAAVTLTLCGPVEALADEWWGGDKAQHLGVGLALGVVSYGGLRLLDDRERRPVRFGLACFMASLPGVAKELYDAGQPGNIFSGKDLFWSTLGAVVGSGVVLGVELLLERLLGRRRAVAPVVRFRPGGGYTARDVGR